MSSKIETKLEFDRQLLLDVGVIDKEGNGYMSVNLAGSLTPVTIGGKRLVLTTREMLREGEWDSRIPFHPLSEQITQGPSQILNSYKSWVVERTKETLIVILDALGELATDVKRQKGLSAKASAFLTAFTTNSFDATTLKTLRQVLKATSDVPEKRFINIFLQNGGANGALRTCQVSFPFTENDDENDPNTYFGVKMPRKTKDKAHIKSLIDYVLGDAEERNTRYTKGVMGGDAPYLNSLLLSFQALGQRINELIDIHGAGCQNLKPLRLDMEWAAQLPKFDDFVRTYGVSVPALPGNVGIEDGEEDEKPKKASPFQAPAEAVGGKQSDRRDDTPPWEEREDRVSQSNRRDRDRDDRRDDRDRDRDRDRERRGGNDMASILGQRGRQRDDRDDRNDDRWSRNDRNDRNRRRDRDRW